MSDISQDYASEREFDAWLDSIRFIDKDGKMLPVTLEDDDSDDPENDRGE